MVWAWREQGAQTYLGGVDMERAGSRDLPGWCGHGESWEQRPTFVVWVWREQGAEPHLGGVGMRGAETHLGYVGVGEQRPTRGI